MRISINKLAFFAMPIILALLLGSYLLPILKDPKALPYKLCQLEFIDRFLPTDAMGDPVNRCMAETALRLNDPSKCYEAKTSQDDCFNAFAEKYSNESYCSKIEDESSHRNCIINIAELKKDVRICNVIVNTQDRDDCYFFVDTIPVKETLNCIEYERESSKNKCLYASIIENEQSKQRSATITDSIDTSMCDVLTLPHFKSICLAWVTKNRDECANIVEPYYKRYCETQLVY